jgi:hypothetical protein
VHVHPNAATRLLRIMETNHLSGVINAGALKALDIPFTEGMRALHDVLGQRMAYFSTPDFADTSPDFGERLARALERKVEAGARGLRFSRNRGCVAKMPTATLSLWMILAWILCGPKRVNLTTDAHPRFRPGGLFSAAK